jgi:uncharacterized protein (DUF2236 family)
MADRSINEELGLFGPDSVIWKVNREAIVALAGSCAILMQFAHPKVAAGVRDHGSYEADPAGRLRRTMELSLAWVFGTQREAMEAARTVNRRHDFVQGPGYSAKDPDLLMWVQATLVYSAISAYRAFVGPLSDADADRYYQETKEIGVLLGIPPERYPANLDEFNAYLWRMIDTGEVTVSREAKQMASVVLQPRFPGVPRLAFMPLQTITSGLLPEPLREQYGMSWGRFERAAFGLCRHVMPLVLAVMPRRIRFLPPARTAYRRLRLQPV